MARSKLGLLQQYIRLYLGLPYWSNLLKDGRIIKNGIYGGKGSIAQIRLAQKKLSAQLDQTKPSNQAIYNLTKKNHLGLDCSGLVYHLANYWHKLHTGKSIKPFIQGTQGRFGPRRVNVASLINPINSIKINNLNEVKTADLIIINKASHVLFVIDKNENTINYVHSSQHTLKRGVHLGKISIIHPQQSLAHQQFSDSTNLRIPHQQLSFPNFGDGI